MNTTRPPITVRKHPFPESTDAPVHWFGGDVFLSHMANGVNLVFPDGERFFIRSVMHYAGRVQDPDLKADLKDFAAQEAQHGKAHEAGFRVLEDQGFEVESWLRWYRKVAFGRLEKLAPPLLRLATTAALEHLTATLATRALRETFLDEAHPDLQTLLRWHACEEIEHKAVAFDVYQEVSGNYPVRVLGMVVGLGCLVVFWDSGTRHLVAQDPAATPEAMREGRARARERGQGRGILLDAFRSWVRPGFHPDQEDNRGLAHDWLVAHGFAVADEVTA